MTTRSGRSTQGMRAPIAGSRVGSDDDPNLLRIGQGLILDAGDVRVVGQNPRASVLMESFVVPIGDLITQITGRWVTRKDALERMLSPHSDITHDYAYVYDGDWFIEPTFDPVAGEGGGSLARLDTMNYNCVVYTIPGRGVFLRAIKDIRAGDILLFDNTDAISKMMDDTSSHPAPITVHPPLTNLDPERQPSLMEMYYSGMREWASVVDWSGVTTDERYSPNANVETCYLCDAWEKNTISEESTIVTVNEKKILPSIQFAICGGFDHLVFMIEGDVNLFMEQVSEMLLRVASKVKVKPNFHIDVVSAFFNEITPTAALILAKAQTIVIFEYAETMLEATFRSIVHNIIKNTDAQALRSGATIVFPDVPFSVAAEGVMDENETSDQNQWDFPVLYKRSNTTSTGSVCLALTAVSHPSVIDRHAIQYTVVSDEDYLSKNTAINKLDSLDSIPSNNEMRMLKESIVKDLFTFAMPRGARALNVWAKTASNLNPESYLMMLDALGQDPISVNAVFFTNGMGTAVAAVCAIMNIDYPLVFCGGNLPYAWVSAAFATLYSSFGGFASHAKLVLVRDLPSVRPWFSPIASDGMRSRVIPGIATVIQTRLSTSKMDPIDFVFVDDNCLDGRAVEELVTTMEDKMLDATDAYVRYMFACGADPKEPFSDMRNKIKKKPYQLVLFTHTFSHARFGSAVYNDASDPTLHQARKEIPTQIIQRIPNFIERPINTGNPILDMHVSQQGAAISPHDASRPIFPFMRAKRAFQTPPPKPSLKGYPVTPVNDTLAFKLASLYDDRSELNRVFSWGSFDQFKENAIRKNPNSQVLWDAFEQYLTTDVARNAYLVYDKLQKIAPLVYTNGQWRMRLFQLQTSDGWAVLVFDETRRLEHDSDWAGDTETIVPKIVDSPSSSGSQRTGSIIDDSSMSPVLSYPHAEMSEDESDESPILSVVPMGTQDYDLFEEWDREEEKLSGSTRMNGGAGEKDEEENVLAELLKRMQQVPSSHEDPFKTISDGQMAAIVISKLRKQSQIISGDDSHNSILEDALTSINGIIVGFLSSQTPLQTLHALLRPFFSEERFFGLGKIADVMGIVDAIDMQSFQNQDKQVLFAFVFLVRILLYFEEKFWLGKLPNDEFRIIFDLSQKITLFNELVFNKIQPIMQVAPYNIFTSLLFSEYIIPLSTVDEKNVDHLVAVASLKDPTITKFSIKIEDACAVYEGFLVRNVIRIFNFANETITIPVEGESVPTVNSVIRNSIHDIEIYEEFLKLFYDHYVSESAITVINEKKQTLINYLHYSLLPRVFELITIDHKHSIGDEYIDPAKSFVLENINHQSDAIALVEQSPRSENQFSRLTKRPRPDYETPDRSSPFVSVVPDALSTPLFFRSESPLVQDQFFFPTPLFQAAETPSIATHSAAVSPTREMDDSSKMPEINPSVPAVDASFDVLRMFFESVDNNVDFDDNNYRDEEEMVDFSAFSKDPTWDFNIKKRRKQIRQATKSKLGMAVDEQYLNVTLKCRRVMRMEIPFLFFHKIANENMSPENALEFVKPFLMSTDPIEHSFLYDGYIFSTYGEGANSFMDMGMIPLPAMEIKLRNLFEYLVRAISRFVKYTESEAARKLLMDFMTSVWQQDHRVNEIAKQRYREMKIRKLAEIAEDQADSINQKRARLIENDLNADAIDTVLMSVTGERFYAMQERFIEMQQGAMSSITSQMNRYIDTIKDLIMHYSQNKSRYHCILLTAEQTDVPRILDFDLVSNSGPGVGESLIELQHIASDINTHLQFTMKETKKKGMIPSLTYLDEYDETPEDKKNELEMVYEKYLFVVNAYKIAFEKDRTQRQNLVDKWNSILRGEQTQQISKRERVFVASEKATRKPKVSNQIAISIFKFLSGRYINSTADLVQYPVRVSDPAFDVSKTIMSKEMISFDPKYVSTSEIAPGSTHRRLSKFTTLFSNRFNYLTELDALTIADELVSGSFNRAERFLQMYGDKKRLFTGSFFKHLVSQTKSFEKTILQTTAPLLDPAAFDSVVNQQNISVVTHYLKSTKLWFVMSTWLLELLQNEPSIKQSILKRANEEENIIITCIDIYQRVSAALRTAMLPPPDRTTAITAESTTVACDAAAATYVCRILRYMISLQTNSQQLVSMRMWGLFLSAVSTPPSKETSAAEILSSMIPTTSIVPTANTYVNAIIQRMSKPKMLEILMNTKNEHTSDAQELMVRASNHLATLLLKDNGTGTPDIVHASMYMDATTHVHELFTRLMNLSLSDNAMTRMQNVELFLESLFNSNIPSDTIRDFAVARARLEREQGSTTTQISRHIETLTNEIRLQRTHFMDQARHEKNNTFLQHTNIDSMDTAHRRYRDAVMGKENAASSSDAGIEDAVIAYIRNGEYAFGNIYALWIVLNWIDAYHST